MDDHPRTASARDNDDRDLIEGMIPAGGATAESGGGNLAQDVGSDDDLTRAVNDPDAHARVAKQAAIDHGQSRPADRGPDR